MPVVKSIDISKRLSAGVVCGGDYVELFQRQTQVYLHRNPEGMALCYNTSGEPVTDAADLPGTDLRADLLWQLNMPTMQWCGKAATHSAHQTSFSLRDGISGLYLCEESDGSLTFQDSDEYTRSHWKLIPFEHETVEYITETTQFYIQNAVSGNRLSQGPLVAGSDADDKYTGLKYHLVCDASTKVQEDDLFIFRVLPRAWVQAFFDTMQMLDVLKRYVRDVKAAVQAAKNDVSRSGGTDPRVEKIRQQYLLPDSDVKSDSQWTGPVLRVLEYLLTKLTFSSNKDLMQRNGIVNVPLQNQLHEIGIVSFLLDDLLPAQFELVSPEDIQLCKLGPYFLRVTQYAYRVVCMMAKGSNVGSRLIFDRLEGIAQYMGGSFEFKVADTVTMAFHGDEKLMRECDAEFIERMWKLGTSTKAQRFVVFIETLLSINDAPLKFNQDRVSRIVRENNVPGLFDIDFKLEAANTLTGTSLAENDVVRFHIGLIQLAASLCAGRHRDSIDFLLTETSLSYSTVLERILDSSIPAAVRTCYVRLMNNLFVDREPFEQHNPVQLCRIMPPLVGSAKEIEDRLGVPPPVLVDPYASLRGIERPTPGFADLKDAIFAIVARQTAIVAKNVRHNEFLVEVIRLARQLLLFGLYDNAVEPGKHHDGVLTLGPEAIELGSKLLLMVDGRRDNVDGIDGDDTGIPTRFRTDLLETNVLMTLRKNILTLIADLFSLRSSTKINILVTAVVESKKRLTATFETFETEGTSPSAETYNPLAAVPAAHGSSPVAKFTSQELEMARAAMEEANRVRVYKGDAEMKTLEDALLDMLRYTGDLDLCFGAFNALVFLKSQNFVFSQTVSSLLSTLISVQLVKTELVLLYISVEKDQRSWDYRPRTELHCRRATGFRISPPTQMVALRGGDAAVHCCNQAVAAVVRDDGGPGSAS